MLYEPKPPSKRSVTIGICIACLSAIIGFAVSLSFAIKSGKSPELAQIDRHSAEQGHITVTSPNRHKLTYKKPDFSQQKYHPYHAPSQPARQLPSQPKATNHSFKPYYQKPSPSQSNFTPPAPPNPPNPPAPPSRHARPPMPNHKNGIGLPSPNQPPLEHFASDRYEAHDESLIKPRQAAEKQSIVELASKLHHFLFNIEEKPSRNRRHLPHWTTVTSIPISEHYEISTRLRTHKGRFSYFIPLSSEDAEINDNLCLFRSPRGTSAIVSAKLDNGYFLFRSSGGHEKVPDASEGQFMVNSYGELAGIWLKVRALNYYPGHNLYLAAGPSLINAICTGQNYDINFDSYFSSYINERLDNIRETIPPRSSMRLNTNIVPGVSLGNYYLGHSITEIQSFQKRIPNGLVHIASKADKISFYFFDQKLICIETTSPQYFYKNLACGRQWNEAETGAMENALQGTKYIHEDFGIMTAIGNGLELEADRNGKISLMRVVLQ